MRGPVATPRFARYAWAVLLRLLLAAVLLCGCPASIPRPLAEARRGDLRASISAETSSESGGIPGGPTSWTGRASLKVYRGDSLVRSLLLAEVVEWHERDVLRALSAAEAIGYPLVLKLYS